MYDRRNFWESNFWETFSFTFSVALQISTVILLMFPTAVVSVYLVHKIASDVVAVCGGKK